MRTAVNFDIQALPAKERRVGVRAHSQGRSESLVPIHIASRLVDMELKNA